MLYRTWGSPGNEFANHGNAFDLHRGHLLVQFRSGKWNKTSR